MLIIFICIFTKNKTMKTKTLKNGLAGLLICIAAILILTELDFNNTKELIGFLVCKLIGFGIGYLGFKLLDYED